jgi:hypothetical protein
VKVSRDVVFDESVKWNWGGDDAGEHHVSDTFTIEYTLAQEGIVTGGGEVVAGGEVDTEDSPAGVQNTSFFDHSDGGHAQSRETSIASSDLDADHDT